MRVLHTLGVFLLLGTLATNVSGHATIIEWINGENGCGSSTTFYICSWHYASAQSNNGGIFLEDVTAATPPNFYKFDSDTGLPIQDIPWKNGIKVSGDFSNLDISDGNVRCSGQYYASTSRTYSCRQLSLSLTPGHVYKIQPSRTTVVELPACDFTVTPFSVSYGDGNCVDNDPPIAVSCPVGNEKVYTDYSAGVPDYTGVTVARDANPFTMTQSPAPGTVLPGGSATVQITAADNQGNSAVICTFSVWAPPPPVTCKISSSITAASTSPEGTTVTLDGSSSASTTDATAVITSYTWAIDGITVASGPSASTYDFTPNDNNQHVIALTVTDNFNCQQTSTHQLDVTNVAPVAFNIQYSEALINTGDELTVQFDFTDAGLADTHIATCTYGGVAYTPTVTQHNSAATSGSVSVTGSFSSGGLQTVLCTMADDDGHSITITAGNIPVCDGGLVSAIIGLTTIPEGSNPVLDGSSSSSSTGGDIAYYSWKVGTEERSTGESFTLGPEKDTADDAELQVTLTTTDTLGCSASTSMAITVYNMAPVASDMTFPMYPVPAGSPITVGFSFTDAGRLDTHTVVCDYEGSVVDGVVTQGSGSGTAQATNTFSVPGLYTVTCTVTDDDGLHASSTRRSVTVGYSDTVSTTAYIPVYDTSAGHVTGGGTFESPVGSYVRDPTWSGVCNFAFTCKYRPGMNVPEGKNKLWIKSGSLDFTSTAFEYLLVQGASSKAKMRGQGKLKNDETMYEFMTTIYDAGGGMPGEDRYHTRIWKDEGPGNADTLIYDNEPLHEDGSWDLSTNIQQGGGIVIHAKKNGDASSDALGSTANGLSGSSTGNNSVAPQVSSAFSDTVILATVLSNLVEAIIVIALGGVFVWHVNKRLRTIEANSLAAPLSSAVTLKDELCVIQIDQNVRK